MKILGIDPGTTKCGWGFFEYDGKNYSQIDWGIFETGKEINIGDRLAVLSTELKKIIQNKRPNVVAIEEIFFMKNI
ncbi:crossover junction endodeoxyribonuclease RuvC, partial [Candidatus Berkelbacteria bacterium CG_4_8_14_3_um_filter_33_6]